MKIYLIINSFISFTVYIGDMLSLDNIPRDIILRIMIFLNLIQRNSVRITCKCIFEKIDSDVMKFVAELRHPVMNLAKDTLSQMLLMPVAKRRICGPHSSTNQCKYQQAFIVPFKIIQLVFDLPHLPWNTMCWIRELPSNLSCNTLKEFKDYLETLKTNIILSTEKKGCITIFRALFFGLKLQPGTISVQLPRNRWHLTEPLSCLEEPPKKFYLYTIFLVFDLEDRKFKYGLYHSRWNNNFDHVSSLFNEAKTKYRSVYKRC